MKRMMTLVLVAAGVGLSAVAAQAETFAESRTFEKGYVKDEGQYMQTRLGEQQLVVVEPLAVEEDRLDRRNPGLADRNRDGVIDFFYDEGRYLRSIPD